MTDLQLHNPLTRGVMPVRRVIGDYSQGRAGPLLVALTGVHGNDLRPSIVAAGLDPDKLPDGDVSTLNFGSGGDTDAKAWKDIWGCGQGIGAIKAVVPAAELVARLKREYEAAKVRVLAA